MADARCILTVSDATRRTIVEHSPSHEAKVRVTPNGIDRQKIQTLSRDEAFAKLRGIVRPGTPATFIGGFLLLLTSGCQDAVRLATGAQEIEPHVLRQLLDPGAPHAAAAPAARGGAPLIIDTRDPASYRAAHLPGAVPLGIREVAGFLHRHPRPGGHLVVTVCAHGTSSLAAAATVEGHGYRHVRSLRGGMERWGQLGYPVEKGEGARPDPGELRPPVVEASLLLQLAVVVTGFGMKAVYMLLALAMAVLLRGRKERDLSLLRRGMLYFFVGEAICLGNYLFMGDSDELDVVHGLGMVAMGCYVPWGLFRFFDDRVLHLADPGTRCAVQRFCGRCWKREPVTCGLQRLFLFVAPSLALVSLLPWTSPVHRLDLITPVFGADVHWFKGVEAQLVEFRLYPVVACGLLLLATAQLLRGKEGMERAQLPFFAGFGFLSYSFTRAALFAFNKSVPAWSSVWEEATELMAVTSIALLLWLFRRQLWGPGHGTPGQETPGQGTD